MTGSLIARYLDHLANTPKRRGQLPPQASVCAAHADLVGFAAGWQKTH